MKAEKIKFLHIVGPDTKNSYGIMSQIHIFRPDFRKLTGIIHNIYVQRP